MSTLTPETFESEDLVLSRNPRYKKYEAHLQRTLATFDTIEEWPDIITFLSRLIKIVQSYPEFPNLPEKIGISRRLSQALNPNLPSGVHQKALETYCILFDMMGSQNLENKCLIWTSGLLFFYSHSSMTVKPILLNIVEKYLLPLGKGLLPCLKSLIIALLPGIEEENSDFFENHMLLLDKISLINFPPSTVFNMFWNVLLSTPPVRKPGLVYLNKKAATLTGTSSLISLAISACLNDNDIFVKRSTLDLLVISFPLHRAENHFSKDEVFFLMNNAIGVVLRKDMSLNRRLFSWLFGEENGYFKKYSYEQFCECVHSSFASKDFQEITRIFKILLSLVDNDEISTTVVPEIIPTIVKVLYDHYFDLENKDATSSLSELVATGKMFLNTVDAYNVWKYLNLILIESVQEALPLIKFVVENLKHVELDCQSYHIPVTAFHILLILEKCELNETDFDVSLWETLDVLHQHGKYIESENSEFQFTPTLLDAYCAGTQDVIEFSEIALAKQIEKVILRYFIHYRKDSVIIATTLFSKLNRTFSNPTPFLEILLSTNYSISRVLLLFMIEFSPSILIPSSKSLLDIMINFLKAAQDDPVIDEAHTVDLIWKLLALNPLLETYLIESLIREFRTEVGFQVFGIIWKFSKDHDKLCIYFSRPLITVLDSLKSKKFRSAAENWFHLYLTSYRHILRPLLTILSSPSIRTAPVTIKESIQYFEYSCEFDSQLVEYAFEQLSYLFQFAKSQVGLELTKLMHQTEKSFFEIISDHCLTFMRTFPVVDKSTYESLQLNACKCLSLAMLALPESFHTELISKKNVFFSDLLQLLHVCIYLEVHMLQVHILDLFGILIPFGFHPITSGFPLGSNLSLSQTSQIKTSPMLSSMDSASINALLILSLTSPTNRILLPNYIEWMTLWMHVFSIYESLVSVFIRQLRVTVQQAMYENQFLAYLRGLQYLFAYIYPISHSPTVPIPEPDQTNALSEFKEAFHRVFPELIDLFVIVSTDPPDHKTSPHQFHFLLSARKRLLRFAQRILEICPKTWLDALVYDWCLRQSRQFSETLLVSQMDLLHLVESTLLRINFSLNSHSGSGSSSISVYTLNTQHFLSFLVLALEKNTDNLESIRGSFIKLFNIITENELSEYVAPTLHIFALYIGIIGKFNEEGALLQASGQLQTLISKSVIPVLIKLFPVVDNKKGSSKSLEHLTFSASEILNSLLKHLLPALLLVFKGSKSITELLQQLCTQALFPLLKFSNDPLYVSALSLVESVSNFGFNSKLWKQELWESHFLAPTFFPIPSTTCPIWIKVLGKLGNELTNCSELLKKREYPGLSNSLTKDSEFYSRCHIFRRLSLLLWSYEKDHFAPIYPTILEKIMESLGLSKGVLTYELFLLFRVMLLRFQGSTLFTLWPFIINEAMRVFHVFLHSGSVLSKDLWTALLASCKFLDLVVCLKPPEFQIYEPIFLGTTPETGLFRQLIEFHLNSSELNLTTGTTSSAGSISKMESNAFQCPSIFLTQLTSLSELIPFHRHCLSYLTLEPFKVSPDLTSIEKWMYIDFVLPVIPSK